MASVDSLRALEVLETKMVCFTDWISISYFFVTRSVRFSLEAALPLSSLDPLAISQTLRRSQGDECRSSEPGSPCDEL